MRSVDGSNGEHASEDPESRTHCKAAFESLHLAIGGAVKPCCLFEGEAGNVSEVPLEGLWNGARLQELRGKMRRGERDGGCRKCYELEDAGGHSLRHDMNTYAPAEGVDTRETPLLRRLDIRLSNLCNLKCRTCGSDYSSKWFADAQKLGWPTAAGALTETFASEKSALAALGAQLETLEEITFAGGEPLINGQQYAILEELIRRGRTDIGLYYISNMTELRFGRRDILALWSKFKRVGLLISMDGHEKVGELVRDGISWERFTKNVATVRATCPHVQMQFNITVSVFNIHSLPQIVESLKRIEGTTDVPCLFNIVQDPPELSIQILPEAMKTEVRRNLKAFAQAYEGTPGQDKQAMAEQVQSVLNYMTARDQSEKIKRFRDHTLKLDEIRGQDTAATVPELEPLLRESMLEGWRRKARHNQKMLLRWASKTRGAKVANTKAEKRTAKA